jgi:hypothetical protein
MAPIWGVPGVTVYSLQVGAGREELTVSKGRVPVRDLGDVDRDAGAFMDTAAIMENLDLVVTIDTSIAHLAGGLARPVWMISAGPGSLLCEPPASSHSSKTPGNSS